MRTSCSLSCTVAGLGPTRNQAPHPSPRGRHPIAADGRADRLSGSDQMGSCRAANGLRAQWPVHPMGGTLKPRDKEVRMKTIVVRVDDSPGARAAVRIAAALARGRGGRLLATEQMRSEKR